MIWPQAQDLSEVLTEIDRFAHLSTRTLIRLTSLWGIKSLLFTQSLNLLSSNVTALHLFEVGEDL